MHSVYDQLLATLYLLWRKRLYGLAAMWVVCLIGWGVVAAIPDTYEARARIFVDTNTVLPRILGTDDVNPMRQVDIVRRTLVSRPNLEKVIRRTDLDLTVGDDPSEMERLFTKLTENITLQSQGDDLFTLTFRSGDPKLTKAENANLAKRVVQNLINIFVEDNLSGQRDIYNETRRFLEEQIDEYEKQLEAAERRRADFETKNLGRLPESANFLQQLQTLRRELDTVDGGLAQATSARRALAAQLASVPANISAGYYSPAVNNGASIDPLSKEGQIRSLEQQVSDALARGYTEQHPDVLSSRRQIENLKSQQVAERKAAAAQPKSAKQEIAGPTQANPVYVDLRSRLFDKDAEIAALTSRRAAISREIDEQQSKAETSPELQAERSKLNRDYEVIQRKYQELLGSREQTLVAQKVETTTDKVQFRIVDPPEVPLKPVAPDRPLLLSGVTLAGLLLGIGIAAAMSHVHTTFITVGNLKSLTSLPVLGGVSAILNDQQRAQERLRLGAFAVAFLVLISVFAVLLTIESIQASKAI